MDWSIFLVDVQRSQFISASYHGARILLRQVSPESEGIFDLIIEVARRAAGDWPAFASSNGIGLHDMNNFIDYAARFLDSMGNYSVRRRESFEFNMTNVSQGYGDAKFLPHLPEQCFHKIASCSTRASTLFGIVKSAMFSPLPSTLGLSDEGGISGYFLNSANMTKSEADEVSQYLVSCGLMLENTRLSKNASTESPLYEIHIASSEVNDLVQSQMEADKSPSFHYKLKYGDHHTELREILAAMEMAKGVCRNDLQQQRLQDLGVYLKSGDVNKHKASSIPWLKDIAPPVETVLGFIEAYRDPLRREWMGLVAIQNKEETEIFQALVESADQLISLLPWNRDYPEKHDRPFENVEYHRPGFMSLESETVLCIPLSLLAFIN